MTKRPERRGLYDPQTEHDACGVGFIVNIDGQKARSIVEDGLEILKRLEHRGAAGADPDTGDGAGILVQIPHDFFERKASELGLELPRRRRYGVGMVFLPPDEEDRKECERQIELAVEEEGQVFIGWRGVPINPDVLGWQAKESLPIIRQFFVGMRRIVPSAYERKLYLIRKTAENIIRDAPTDPDEFFHIASLSTNTVVYKGLLLPEQMTTFYPDLHESDFVSAIALVHSRFSTNTFPTWDLAQPFRFMAHNGEINTLKGNANWMRARRSQLKSAKFEGRLDRLFPVIVPRKSDSAQFDNMLELLHLGGRSLPQAAMLMVPEAWENDELMDPERRAYYDYSSSLMEPWDGPAAVCFTDGKLIGATLDRNGLRPARYVITNDGRVVLASEIGVLDFEPSNIKEKGRLSPGRIFLVDTEEKAVRYDDEVKAEVARRWPYRRWLDHNEFELAGFEDGPQPEPLSGKELQLFQRQFGWSDEDLRLLIAPMADSGKEPIGSMGDDTPLAVLSNQAPPLFNYFRQLFAQVTNPAIDPIREELVTSLKTMIGQGGNSFDETPEQCHRVHVASPILTNAQLAKLEHSLGDLLFDPIRVPLLYDVENAVDGLEAALGELCNEVSRLVDDGRNIIILTDRDASKRKVSIPSLLAVSAVHQRLVTEGTRMQVGLIVETAEAREVHHFAVLLGFGCAAICPYLVYDSIRDMAADGQLHVDAEVGIQNYVKSVNKGIKKVMSKMGISTVQSYRGAQIFEAVGLNRSLTDTYFGSCPSRLEGIGFPELGREVQMRWEQAHGEQTVYDWDELPLGGEYQWRRRGALHKWNPATVAKLQAATKNRSRAEWDEYSKLVDDEDEGLVTLRGLLEFDVDADRSIPLDEVEPASEIMKRFCTGAMSFGSISAEAHESLAIAMNRIGGKSNTGEGGEEPHRWKPDANGDLRRSAIKQVASGRFGVHTDYLVNADELQIKVAQGAKPGEGGQLPGHKVSERIAAVRCSTPGVTLISPPPHHDIYSIEDLKQLITDLKTVNEQARIGVKLVSEVGVGTIAAGVAKAFSEVIIIAGASGGTGASPMSSIKRAGLPWELGIAETQQVMVHQGLRERVRLQVDGGMRTGRDIVVGALLGGEEFGFATAPLIVMGCIMLRKCHLNTCSVGVATQMPELTERFTGDPDDVIAYFKFLSEDIRVIMAQLGFRTFEEMVGQVQRLKARKNLSHWKAEKLDLSMLLIEPLNPRNSKFFCTKKQEFGLEDHMDRELIEATRSAWQGGEPVSLERQITNRDRTVGAMLSGVIAKHMDGENLKDRTISVKFDGSAGQSFGAFLKTGITFRVEGDVNDYIGKGLSGGRIIVHPPLGTIFEPEDNTIVGNVALYGATSGEAYFSGMAGERFAVRNSGASVVVEGVGDHCCEYMTGGLVICLGATGRNFAAGMSGGVAFVLDRNKKFSTLCNLEMVELESVIDESDINLLQDMIQNHVRYTRSRLGQRVLDNWDVLIEDFVKVMPTEYKRVLQRRRAKKAAARAKGRMSESAE